MKKTKKITLLLAGLLFTTSLWGLGGCQSSETETSHRNSSTHSTSSSSKENSSGSGSNNTSDKTSISVKYTWASDFKDGYAFVAYEKSDEEYGAIIDTEGNIIYKTAGAYTIESSWINLGNDAFAVEYESGNEYVNEIINAKGKTVASSKNGDFDEILAGGDGIAFVYKETTTVTSVDHLYGTINSQGTWIQALNKIEGYNKRASSVYYCNEGFFSWLDNNKNDIIYNSQTADVIRLNNSYDFYDSYNSGRHANKFIRFNNGYTCLKTKGASIYDNATEELISLPDYITLHADGTWEEISPFWRISNGKLVDNSGEYLTITDPVNNTTVTYKDYPATNVSDVECHGDYTLIVLSGAGGYFFTVIDSTGKQNFEPIKCASSYIYHSSSLYYPYFNYSEGKIVYHAGGNGSSSSLRYSCVVDSLNGTELIGADKEYYMSGFHNGISTVKVIYYKNSIYHSYYIYINEQGERILSTLYES